MGMFDNLLNKVVGTMGGLDITVSNLPTIDVDKNRQIGLQYWNDMIAAGATPTELDTSDGFLKFAEMITVTKDTIPDIWTIQNYTAINENTCFYLIRSGFVENSPEGSKFSIITSIANDEMFYDDESRDKAELVIEKKACSLYYVLESWDDALNNFNDIINAFDNTIRTKYPVKLIGSMTRRLLELRYNVLDMTDVVWNCDHSKPVSGCNFNYLALPKLIVKNENKYNVFERCTINTLYIKSVGIVGECILSRVFDSCNLDYIYIGELTVDGMLTVDVLFLYTKLRYFYLANASIKVIIMSRIFMERKLNEVTLLGKASRIIADETFKDSSFVTLNIPMLDEHNLKTAYIGMTDGVYRKRGN